MPSAKSIWSMASEGLAASESSKIIANSGIADPKAAMLAPGAVYPLSVKDVDDAASAWAPAPYFGPFAASPCAARFGPKRAEDKHMIKVSVTDFSMAAMAKLVLDLQPLPVKNHDRITHHG